MNQSIVKIHTIQYHYHKRIQTMSFPKEMFSGTILPLPVEIVQIICDLVEFDSIESLDHFLALIDINPGIAKKKYIPHNILNTMKPRPITYDARSCQIDVKELRCIIKNIRS